MFVIVNLPFAYFGIETDENDIIIKSAPIGRWMLGDKLGNIEKWVEGKGGILIREAEYKVVKLDNPDSKGDTINIRKD